MAKDPSTDYDMGVNRLPYARIYVLRDGLNEPEFGDPFVSTALGWDSPSIDDVMSDLDREYSYRLEAESYARSLREQLERVESELADLKAKTEKASVKKRKALVLARTAKSSNADLPPRLQSMLNDP